MENIVSTLSDSHIRIRLDGDVISRCLLVTVALWLIGAILNAAPACLGLWVTERFLWTLLTLALLAAVAKSAVQVHHKGKAVLITGCDDGFGLRLAKHLHSLGFKVYAGCLLQSTGGAGAEELASIDPHNLRVLQLDVTSDSEWVAAVETIKSETGDLWGLVNNAGWATFGEVEWVSMEAFHKITNINLLGAVRGVKACLPLLRTGGGGRIVSITSGMVRCTVPSRGAYAMTKCGLTGFSDSLRHEMEPFGVKVSVLEPGNFLGATNFSHKFIEQQADGMWSSMNDEVRAAYGEKHFQMRTKSMIKYLETGYQDVQPVIEAYTNALIDVFPQQRYNPMDLRFRAKTFIATHLPEIVYDTLYVRIAKQR